MSFEAICTSPLDIVCQKLSDYKGDWERIKHDIVHDPGYSPIEKSLLVGTGVWYIGKLLNVF